MKYKITSYELQDSRWGPAIIETPMENDLGSVTLSEPTEFGIYFSTKGEADKYAVDFLKERGASDKGIEIRTNKSEGDRGDYNL